MRRRQSAILPSTELVDRTNRACASPKRSCTRRETSAQMESVDFNAVLSLAVRDAALGQRNGKSSIAAIMG